MKYSTKELVGEYSYSNANENRELCKNVVINGRTYIKTGEFTATTVVAFQYKVWNPSVNHNEYVVLMGVARQNPGDVVLDKEMGLSIAAENAMIDPQAVLKFPVKLDEDYVLYMMQAYTEPYCDTFVKTKEELLLTNDSIKRFNRSTKATV